MHPSTLAVPCLNGSPILMTRAVQRANRFWEQLFSRPKRADHTATLDQTPYFVWKVAARRFAITPGPEPSPVIGYVLKNAGEDSWSIERKGRVLSNIYGSLDEAAQALFSIETT